MNPSLGEVSAEQWVRDNREHYLREVRELAKIKLGARDLVAFVICTPQQSYELAVQQWRGWLQTGKVEGNYKHKRQEYLDELTPVKSWWLERRGVWEGGQVWCDRLEQGVKGLGPVKAAFATCLMEPLSNDVNVCIDVHMLRFLCLPTHDSRLTDSKYARGVDRACQTWIKYCAKQWEMPPFAYQWCVWDWQRSGGKVRTSITRDLMEGR